MYKKETILYAINNYYSEIVYNKLSIREFNNQ
jgi:hypothetical protein